MNRKKLIIGTLFLFLIAGLIWFSIPEYGDSYSERQRELANKYALETEAAYSKEYGVDRYREEISVWPDFLRGMFEYSERKLILYQRKNTSGDSSYNLFCGRWPSKCEELRKSSDLFWSPLHEKQGEVLSYSGMSDLLLKRKADAGDMTACLNVVYRYLKQYRRKDINSLLLAGKYLSRLEESGMVGISYLKKVYSESAVYFEKRTDPSLLPGYKDFLCQIDQGNLMLYRILDLLVKNDRNALDFEYCDSVEESREAFLQEPYKRLKTALENKVSTGDALASRDLSLLLLSQERLLWKIEKEMNRETILTRIGKSFPDRIPFPRYSHSETRDEVFERERDLIKCGEAGDDEAKDAWVNYFMERRGFWQKQDWERAIQWADDLQKKGYVPMCRDVLLVLEVDMNIWELVSRKSHIKVYSSSQDEEKIAELRKYLYEKGCIETLVDDFYKRKWTVADEKEFRYVIDSIAQWDSSRLIPYHLRRGYGDNIAPELFPVLFQVLEKSAAEGNMDVIVFLIREYDRGKYLPADREKAQLWAKVAKEKKGSISSLEARGMNWFEWEMISSDPFTRFLELKELQWCLEGKEGQKDIAEAMAILKRISNLTVKGEEGERLNRSIGYWMYGRFCEKGIGKVGNYKEALYHYIEGLYYIDFDQDYIPEGLFPIVFWRSPVVQQLHSFLEMANFWNLNEGIKNLSADEEN